MGLRTASHGEVRVGLTRQGDDVVLVVSDRGRDSCRRSAAASLGLMLVDRLVRQVSGRLELKTPPGTRYRLTFRLEQGGLPAIPNLQSSRF